MSVNSYQQRDDDFLLGKANRIVLPPSKYFPGSDNNKLPSLVLENNKVPSLVPEVLLSSLQEGHRIQLSKGNTLCKSGLLRTLTQSDPREELSPVRSVSHRTVLPKISSGVSSSQSQRRVVLPQGKSNTSRPTQVQPDCRLSSSLQTMAKQAYEEELEFLKLKLRYMQNDIEFKRRQIYSAKMIKLKNSTALNKWNQSSKTGLIQGGASREVQWTASSRVLPEQHSNFHNRSPSSAWAASATRLSQMKTATSMLHNSSNLQGSGVPSSALAPGSHRSVVGPTRSDSLVTGGNKSGLITNLESNKFSVATGISKSSHESTKASLVTGSNKSSVAAEGKKCGLVTEGTRTSLATGSSKSCLTAENNTSCLITESNKSSMATGNNKYGLANGSNSSLAANLSSAQLSPETTLSKWKPTPCSADVRTIYSAGERAAPNLTSTACIQYVNSMPPLQKNIAHFHTANKKTEQATSSPANPSIVLCKLNKETPFSHPEAASASSASIFIRLGSQRVSEMPEIVHGSPDKRLVVVSSKVTPAVLQAAPVASDLTQTLGSTSLSPAAAEAFTNYSLYKSNENINDVAYRQGASHTPRTEYCSDSELIWKHHSVTPASKYRFVKNPSCVNVDTANTSTVCEVNSVMLPSSPKYFTSPNTLSDKDAAAAMRNLPSSRLTSQQAQQTAGSLASGLTSLQSPRLNIPAAAQVVNKYKLKRRSPVFIPQAAAQLFPNKRLSSASIPQAAPQFHPIKMLLEKSSPVPNQAYSKSLSQSAKIQHKFVSKYSLIKTASHMTSVSNNVATCGVDSVTSPSLLHDSSMCSNSALPTQPVMAARRASQGSRLTFRNPNLKIHTAAKLVSKYKLKRLSPTLTLQAAPQFHNRFLYKPASVHNLTGIKTPGQYSKNQLKLDRRLIAMETANPKVSYKKLEDEYAKFTVLTQKHKIDRRLAMGQSPKAQDASLSLSKFTVDKRRKADTVLRVKATSPVCAGRNVLDRPVSKAGLFKLQMAADRSIKHCWAGPRPVAAGKVRSGTRNSSKYSWKKPCPPTAQGSRFKWSRPNVQAQNEAWQQLRQKLQLLLMKKHRHSRYNFFKYPAMAASPRAYSGRPQVGDYRTSLVTIDGVTYKSSTCKLTRTRRLSSRTVLKRAAAPAQCSPLVGSGKGAQRQTMKLISLRGVHFHVDRSGKRLCRTQSATVTGALATAKKSTSSHADVNVVNFANRVIHRSIAITTAKYKKNNQKSKKPHCKFFSRFGKCRRGDNCPYVHDPEKVAVCTRFLRGRCEIKDCPFSHKASVNKMPVCLFFLRGSCSRESCPYLHVRVNPSAPVCKDFRNGFCALGEKCKKIHSHVCPSFAMNGVCSRAGTCTMLHRAGRKEQEPPSQDKPLIQKSSDPCTNSPSHPGKSMITPDFTVPLAAQPSFISLGITPTAPAPTHVTSSAKSASCLGTTPTPSFISLETTPAPSFISLETNPAPSFISLETNPAPSFISLESRQQEGSNKKRTGDLSGRKPELTPGKDGSTDSQPGQDVSSTGTLLNIRPSFMTKRMSAQNN